MADARPPAEFQQQILTAFGLEEMTPTEQAAWDAYGRAVEAERRNREAFGEWVRQRYATAEAAARRIVREAMVSDD